MTGSAVAQDVTITSEGGGLTLDGRIIGYDGTFLELDTAYGLMTLKYDDVTCSGDPCPDPDTHVPVIRLSGAARIGEVMIPAMIEAYARRNGWQSTITVEDPDHLTLTLTNEAVADVAVFQLRLTNTDEGFADLIAFEADIVLALREIRAEEAARAKMIGLGDLTDPRSGRIVGFDAMVPIVHPGIGLSGVSLLNVARAYRGLVTNWDDIGGPDEPIVLHLGPSTGGPWQFFFDQVVAVDAGTLAGSVIRHESAEAVAAAVAQTSGSLGIVPYGESGGAQPLALRDACGFISVPQNTSIKTQDYPLVEPVFLYHPDRLQRPVVEDFLAWLRGPEAQLVVRRAGFVDQGAVPIPLDGQGQRFANAILQAGEDIPLQELQRMVRVLKDRTRLSMSFRFEVGSTRLDAASRSNLLALGQAVRDGRFDGQSLLLVGFGDGRGAPLPNRDLSSARAEAVKRDLLAALGGLPDSVVVETEAFGEALPIGCDDTEWGRQMNRRVELWVDQG